ncbi:MAG: phosphoenolpyruvate-protein phosphotransferase system enzyme [Thermosediminibacterales bacterium]|nr:phosphoenolpyruvate-protein phosphotransferase system enzyme [Thermosediminibacterales bacterium]
MAKKGGAKLYKGVAASPGIAIGKVYLLEEQETKINRDKIDITQTDTELTKYKQAVEKTKQQLTEIKERVAQKMGEKKAEIFNAHIMILDDPTLTAQVEAKIKDQQITAENAVDQVITELITIFENMEDEYMKERAADIKDVGARIIKNILGIPIQTLTDLKEEVIIVAKDLTPSDTAQMDKQKIIGFATDMGGRTSHTAIMARSLEIPAVVGLSDITQKTKNQDTIIIDGTKGIVEINPDEKALKEYKEKQQKYIQEVSELKKQKDLPGQTKDGHRIELSANIGTPQDIKGALANGAEGIGLYRTEFLYMDRDSMPGEEEQFEAYKEVAEKMGGKPVIIRTLDIGGDKNLPYLNLPEEMNPFLGVRAIRLCLKEREMFKTQLRAILKASNYGNIKIMYPMISTIEEVRKANQILNEVKKQLSEDNIPYDKNIEVGIMVEVPSTAINADIFAKEVDFFSIGTNDLIQYTMAVDRMNESLSGLYDPYNPAILRLIKNVIDASHKAGKWTGMCGEMAGEPRAALILLGMGIDELSMSAVSIPRVKKVIRSVTKKHAEEIAEKVMNMGSSDEICSYLDEELKTLE